MSSARRLGYEGETSNPVQQTQPVSAKIIASSTESVGTFRLGKIAKGMIERDLDDAEDAKTI